MSEGASVVPCYNIWALRILASSPNFLRSRLNLWSSFRNKTFTLLSPKVSDFKGWWGREATTAPWREAQRYTLLCCVMPQYSCCRLCAQQSTQIDLLAFGMFLFPLRLTVLVKSCVVSFVSHSLCFGMMGGTLFKVPFMSHTLSSCKLYRRSLLVQLGFNDAPWIVVTSEYKAMAGSDT